MNTNFGKWCYSLTDEDYTGHFETESEAHCAAQDDIDSGGQPGEVRDYWVAKTAHPLDLINQDIGPAVLDMLNERTYDEVGGDDEPLHMKPDEVAVLGTMVMTYIREHASVRRFGIKDPIKHQHVAGSDANT